MARIELLDPNKSDDPEVREWASRVSNHDGEVSAHFQAETQFPELMMRVYNARVEIARHREIGPELFMKIAIAISMANDCQFCTGAYSTLLSNRLGSHEAVREFQEALGNDELEGKDSDFIDFALKLLDDPHAMTDDDFESLRKEYDLSDRGFVGLFYAVNIVSGYNRVTVGFDLEYDHPYPKEWADPESVVATASEDD